MEGYLAMNPWEAKIHGQQEEANTAHAHVSVGTLVPPLLARKMKILNVLCGGIS